MAYGLKACSCHPLRDCWIVIIIQRFSRAGPRGRTREWATLGVHPLSWLLSNNRLEEVCGTLSKGTFLVDCCKVTKTKDVPLVLLILFLFLFLPVFAQPVKCLKRTWVEEVVFGITDLNTGAKRSIFWLAVKVHSEKLHSQWPACSFLWYNSVLVQEQLCSEWSDGKTPVQILSITERIKVYSN